MWAWDQQRRQLWITEEPPAAPTPEAADLVAEHRRLTAAIPPDVTDQLGRLRDQLVRLEQDRIDLQTATGRWAGTPVNHAHQTLREAERRQQQNIQRAQDPHLGLLARRRARHAEHASTVIVTQANTAWQETIQPYTSELAGRHLQLEHKTRQLEADRLARIAFLDANPEIVARITELEHAIAHQPRHVHPPAVRSRPAELRPQPRHDPHLQHLHAQHAQTVSSAQIHGPSI